jgi:glycosyltransferase involved in cell wall biosynthesis
MAQEMRVGIIYNYNENWIGGAYYIQNLISSLNFIPEKEQPNLHILTQDKSVFQNLMKVTGYKKLKFIQYEPQFTVLERIINRLTTWVLNKYIILNKPQLDCILPVFGLPEDLKHISNIIFWIPDLQDKNLPGFFLPEEIQERQLCFLNMIALNYPIVFSSHSVLNDFIKFFPDAKNRLEVLQFAVVNPPLESTNILDLKVKYGIEGEYFISPNQFWQHKNHTAIIEAAKILKNRGIPIKIVFTGKEYDYRNPDYTTDLKQKVLDYQLEKEILFLGFIDRMDQLILMKNAQAVIQPSLYEGWSTVVEDAKALNQTLIVSNISVHKEQLEDMAYFFAPDNFDELATLIEEVTENTENKIRYNLDYSLSILNFARKLNLLLKNQKGDFS